MKTCPKCREAKPLDAFFNNASRPDGKATWCKVCHHADTAARHADLKLRAMEAIGPLVCTRCGFTDLRALTIDHIAGDGAEHRASLSGSSFKMLNAVLADPAPYQILCWNCNTIKRIENGEFYSITSAKRGTKS